MDSFGLTNRRICYVSGTRADFGLMRSTLLRIACTAGLELSVVVTGMHLSASHGMTVGEIRGTGLRIAAEAPVCLDAATGATMARNIGAMIGAFVDAFEREEPRIVLLLGDRGEMLAGALAAIHLNIPVAHIHGGERSGTVDEPIRHAISKLSHIHCAATHDARERLIRMGEMPEHVHVTGAPGIDGLAEEPRAARDDVFARHGFDPARPFALMIYHPILQEAENAAAETAEILGALRSRGMQILALEPNSDAGADGVRDVLAAAAGKPGQVVANHLPRAHFLDAMAQADVLIGNSSAGIIEAASFGTPVVNIGKRQNLRERNRNVVDVERAAEGLANTLDVVLAKGRFPRENVYGDGRAAERITALLAAYDLAPALLMKANGY